MTKSGAFSAALAEIQPNFIRRISEYRPKFERFLIDLESRVVSPALVSESRSCLHKISGSAGMLGFSDLGDAARLCEDLIIQSTPQTLDVPALADGLRRVIGLINQAETSSDFVLQ